ncbi:MAG: papain-like cysteine protease family protein [Candidatus Methylumidiphilus sp.]
MPTIILDVPLHAQERANSCWNTAAYMIWLYWQGQTMRQGPMNTVATAYARSDSSGLSPQEFITLANTVGLRGLPLRTLHSSAHLHGYLTNHGPLWCAGYWYGVGHIIVLTGVKDGTIYFNDPDGGVKKKETVNWFNTRLANSLAGCLMYKDLNRY